MTNINEAAADLFAINAEIKALTARADELKAMLKANGSFTNELYDVRVSVADRTTIDTKLLKSKYETIANECSKVQAVTTVTVKKI